MWDDKAGTLRKYSIPPNDGGDYEDDDLIPVCLGGDNADPRNHWPQPLAEAHEKDDLEWYACRDVCESGDSLAWWQSGFRIDWRPLYRKIFRRDP